MTPDPEHMATQVLGMARDDEHRTEMLVAMHRVDPAFRKQRDLGLDEIQDDINLHYRDPVAAARSFGVLGYMDLSERLPDQGPIARTFTRVEQSLRRLCEPAVREAIHSGLIDK